MNGIGRSCRGTLRFRSLACIGLAGIGLAGIGLAGIGLAGIGLAVAGCGAGGAPAVNAPPASAHTAAEQAAVTSWFVQTNQMLTKNDFRAVDRVTTLTAAQLGRRWARRGRPRRRRLCSRREATPLTWPGC